MSALHHEAAGPSDGPVLVLFGSLGTPLAMWDRQLPLAERMRLIRVDGRGHGESPSPPGPWEIEDLARDVLELMDALALERAHFCGLSLGGMVGMWLGANAPERIDRLVLMCTAAYMPPASMWEERIETVRAAGSVAPLADATLGRWLTPQADPKTVAWIRSMFLATSAESYAECCGAIERMDLRDSLPRVRARTLVISGADDPSTPPERQRLIAESIPAARHAVVEHAAHSGGRRAAGGRQPADLGAPS